MVDRFDKLEEDNEMQRRIERELKKYHPDLDKIPDDIDWDDDDEDDDEQD